MQQLLDTHPLILMEAAIVERLRQHGVVGKFVDALPLYRQEKIFAREGIDISRQTMAGWMIELDEKLNALPDADAAALTARTAFDTIEVAKAGLAAAEEAFRLQTVRYAEGAATTTDLLDAETEVTRASRLEDRAASGIRRAACATSRRASSRRSSFSYMTAVR